MANSYTVLSSFVPVALGLDPLFASKDFGPNKDFLDRCRFHKCDYYVLIHQQSSSTGSVQNWPMFENDFLYG